MISKLAPRKAATYRELSAEDLRRAYRWMLTSRRLDDREILLKRQNRIYFQISGAGHEAVQVAAAMVLRPGVDWVYPYYRDRALVLALGITPLDMLLQAVGARNDPASGGRQMPSHWGNPKLNIVSASSPTGTQFLQAAGCAEATRYLPAADEEITFTSGGDGATSEGEFWESLNLACLERLPLLYLIEDNGYAISVPVEKQTAGGSISALVAGFPNLHVEECDGCDFTASYDALARAAAWCRARQGPALVHAHVIRPYSHSLSDDERLYRTEAERQAEATRDPIYRFPEWLIEHGYAERSTLQWIGHEVEVEIQRACEEALKAAAPEPGSYLRHLYSERTDPTSSEFLAEPHLEGEPRTMVDAINLTLAEEMRRDPRILVFGEDVADCSREENLPLVKGKGGVFKATQGLQREFGSHRCFNTPLAEAAIVGRAIGLATRGLKPVAEIQFFDYIWPAMMQIRDELATLRWRSHGAFSCPVVIRVPIGGYLGGGAVYHSQSGEVIFTHIPGLRVVMPSNALDACGLLRTALRCDDPVLFLEHKKLYREPYNRSPHPGKDYTIPFGQARVVKPGQDLTVITYGALVQKALQAAAEVERRDPARRIEVIDLRSLAPYDWRAIGESVKRTNRVLIAYEDNLSFGYGAEIAARIADELFSHLDAPLRRVAAKDTWIAYNPQLEDEILPQTSDLVREMEWLLRY
ncbi:MAG: thiamine pyrophosphate-dependent enzyme [Bryobacteraceae bacterium]|nr:thiamine pyrophosphate-dependent enzyme [Bryobacteraceae bacterium]MDW8378204.1 thiamine pyrophosphate-dependent enzyme [Bryobacterales bacterium]